MVYLKRQNVDCYKGFSVVLNVARRSRYDLTQGDCRTCRDHPTSGAMLCRLESKS